MMESKLDRRFEDAQSWHSLGVTAHKAWLTHRARELDIIVSDSSMEAAKAVVCVD
jgi:hypothetical protein